MINNAMMSLKELALERIKTVCCLNRGQPNQSFFISQTIDHRRTATPLTQASQVDPKDSSEEVPVRTRVPKVDSPDVQDSPVDLCQREARLFESVTRDRFRVSKRQSSLTDSKVDLLATMTSL